MTRRVITKQLGELLIERKMITPAQLEEALRLQLEEGGLLGQILVRLGYTSEEMVAQVLTVQYGFPYLPLKHYTIDGDFLSIIPENVARQYCLVPVERFGDTLAVAMADPLNTSAIEDIEMLSHCSVQVFVATLSDVTDAIQRHYGGGEPHGA